MCLYVRYMLGRGKKRLKMKTEFVSISLGILFSVLVLFVASIIGSLWGFMLFIADILLLLLIKLEINKLKEVKNGKTN